MIFIIQMISRLASISSLKRSKPFILHASLIFFVFLYAFVGGMIFNQLEAEAMINARKEELQRYTECVVKILKQETFTHGHSPNLTAEEIVKCWYKEPDERSQWSYVTATLYGFGIVTTLGYNRIAPITIPGRLFCVFYGLCGIPITMIIIANFGQYLNQFAGTTRRNLEAYQERRRRSKASITGDDMPESSIEFTSIALLVVFLLYVSFGAILLPALNGEVDFLNGLYFNFLCLTAIDFGQLVPQNVAYLPITFLYVCFGLAITTIAIDVGSEYMKKLHHLGKKVKNVAQAKIWFGGKTLKVRDLLHAVGKKCGIDPHVIDAMDLDNVVERTIAINEGREPPPDTNEEPPPPKEPEPSNYRETPTTSRPPSEVCPLIDRIPSLPKRPASVKSSMSYRPPSKSSSIHSDLVLRTSFFDTVSHPSLLKTPSLEMKPREAFQIIDELVAIDVDIPEEYISEPTVTWQESIQVNRSDPVEVETPSDIGKPEEVEPVPPVLVMEEFEEVHQEVTPSMSPSMSRTISPVKEPEMEPKKFKEKKERYGRDPMKLYETYQEEWHRLERLGMQLGPRRKSVLDLETFHRKSPLHEGHMEKSPSGTPSKEPLKEVKEPKEPKDPIDGKDGKEKNNNKG